MKKRPELLQDFQDLHSLYYRLEHKGRKVPNLYNLTKPQIELLYMLKHCGALTIKEIAERGSISSSAATQLVDTMVITDYLERTEDSEDRRNVRVKISRNGLKRLNNFHKKNLCVITKIMEVLSDQELSDLNGHLEKVLSHLQIILSGVNKNEKSKN
jgi:DNA-binding MarR family transcriptional regulator